MGWGISGDGPLPRYVWISEEDGYTLYSVDPRICAEAEDRALSLGGRLRRYFGRKYDRLSPDVPGVSERGLRESRELVETYGREFKGNMEAAADLVIKV